MILICYAEVVYKYRLSLRQQLIFGGRVTKQSVLLTLCLNVDLAPCKLLMTISRYTATFSLFVKSWASKNLQQEGRNMELLQLVKISNVRVLDQMSERKYKNIHLLEEKKRKTSNHKG